MRIHKPPSPAPVSMPIRVLIQNTIVDGSNPSKVRRRVAFDVLLPLAGEHVHGGLPASAALGGQLLQALQPYFRPGAPVRAPHDCFSLLRCSSQGMHLAHPLCPSIPSRNHRFIILASLDCSE